MNAALPQALEALRGSTPARVGLGRSGPRPRTADRLVFLADHAAARDAVHATVPEDFEGRIEARLSLRTEAGRDRDVYLLRPEMGRRLTSEDAERLRTTLPRSPQVLVAVGDGLSTEAVAIQVPRLLPALMDGLRLEGFAEIAGPVWIVGARVGVLDHLGEILQPRLGILLVGERPGLATAQSLSAYMGWMPGPGRTDADRNVVSNIHDQGMPALEAAAVIASWAAAMARQQRSGVGFRPEG